MPGIVPNPTLIFRIVHISNLKHLLKYGICTKTHENADPEYIDIGDKSLIDNRDKHQVKVIPPGGKLGDYVPFYFGPLSPMLLKIKNGTNGITMRPQKDIVYLVCNLNSILEACPQWCFTDGQAKNEITAFYNNKADLDKIDWEMVDQHYWSNTEEDLDRMRRKQAEFLIKEHVPVHCILGIATYNEEANESVRNIMANLGIKIPTGVRNNYYY
jgi:hypothetical protein